MKSSVLFLVVMLSAAISARASADYFLKIEGVKGESIASRTKSTDNAVSMQGLPPGVPLRCVLEVDNKKYSIVLDADLDGDGVDDRVLSAPASGTKSPRDAASGMATGKRQHKPITFYCTIDPDGTITRFKSESQAKSRCESFRESPTKASTGKTAAAGGQAMCFKVEFKEVLVSGIESVSFTFQKIV